MNDIHFLRSEYLYLFIPFALLTLLLILRKRDTAIWQKICSKDLMPYILTNKSHRQIIPRTLTLATLSLLIFALAGPAWKMISIPLITSQSGLVIALDLSTSMDAQDIKPSRLQRAIYKINDILNMRHEGQTALIVFSEEPFTVVPLTDDTATIKSLLPVLETKLMPSQGHQVDRAILKASELLTQGGITNGSILLVTSELSNHEMDKAIGIAKEHGTKISVLGVGTEEAVPIPLPTGGFVKDSKGALIITTLSKNNLGGLAHATNGSYATISMDDSDVNALSKIVSDKGPAEDYEKSELTQNKWHDQGYLLVVFALPFAAFFFRRGMTLMVLMVIPYTLQAFSWNDLWKTPDQQAEELFQREDYQQAKELFQNPDWQAAANYKLGDYETASQLLEGNPTVDGLYNYGTARAKMGDFKAALDAYEKVLDLESEHEDALYNKMLIEEHLKKQQQQQQQDKNQQEEKKSDQDKNQSQDQDNNQKSDQQDNQEKNKDNKENQSKESNQDQSKDNPDQGKDNPEEKDQSKDPANDSNKPEEKDEKQKEDLKDQFQDQVDKELKKEEKKKPEQKPEIADQEEENEDEQRQIDQRWLQRIKDDPGGLLRRKFLQQYRQGSKKSTGQ